MPTKEQITPTGNMSPSNDERRPKWREWVANALYRTGSLRMLQKISRSFEVQSTQGGERLRWHRVSSPKFAILCYHRVAIAGLPVYSPLPAELFEAQIRFLRKRYRIVSLDALCNELQNPGPVEQSVAITFDDGYHDLYTQAFPILREYQVPATMFIIVGSIEAGEMPWYDRVFGALDAAPAGKLIVELDRPRTFILSSPATRCSAALEIVWCMRHLPDWRRKECSRALEKQIALPRDRRAERMLTWQEIRTMHQCGIAFGSHTMTHPVVSRLTPADMERELQESKQILEEKIGTAVQNFAFPFGKIADCGEAATEILVRCGYRSASTTVWGINTPGVDPYRLHRVHIGEERDFAMFVLKLNELFLRVKNHEPRHSYWLLHSRGM